MENDLTLAQMNQAALQRGGGGLGPVRYPELAEDTIDVTLDSDLLTMCECSCCGAAEYSVCRKRKANTAEASESSFGSDP
jgi:hypothetical protein